MEVKVAPTLRRKNVGMSDRDNRSAGREIQEAGIDVTIIFPSI
jgi:hypothetical protein